MQKRNAFSLRVTKRHSLVNVVQFPEQYRRVAFKLRDASETFVLIIPPISFFLDKENISCGTFCSYDFFFGDPLMFPSFSNNQVSALDPYFFTWKHKFKVANLRFNQTYFNLISSFNKTICDQNYGLPHRKLFSYLDLEPRNRWFHRHRRAGLQTNCT